MLPDRAASTRSTRRSPCANDSRFGLGANVYTRDLRSAIRCMRELQAGTVWINDPLTDNDAGPFGGFKQSGHGPGARAPRGSRRFRRPSTCTSRSRPRARRTGGTHTADPAQARGVLVLPRSSRGSTTGGSTRSSGPAPMRDRALTVARLDARDLIVVDVGAGTGFTTEGIVARVDAAQRDDARPEPRPARARAQEAGARGRDASCTATPRTCPSPTDGVDRYVSTGSIEYWPDPQRAIAEAYRVRQPGRHRDGRRAAAAANRLARRAADDVDALPGRGRVPRVVRARGLHRRRGRPRRAGLVPRPPSRTRWRSRAQAGAGPSRLAAGAAPQDRLGAALGRRGRCRFAARFAVGGRPGCRLRPARRRARRSARKVRR